MYAFVTSEHLLKEAQLFLGVPTRWEPCRERRENVHYTIYSEGGDSYIDQFYLIHIFAHEKLLVLL